VIGSGAAIFSTKSTSPSISASMSSTKPRAIRSTSPWIFFSAAGVKRALISLRWARCFGLSISIRVAGRSKSVGAPSSPCCAASTRGWMNKRGPFRNTSGCLLIAVMSACRVIAQKGIGPSPNQCTGDSARSRRQASRGWPCCM